MSCSRRDKVLMDVHGGGRGGTVVSLKMVKLGGRRKLTPARADVFDDLLDHERNAF